MPKVTVIGLVLIILVLMAYPPQEVQVRDSQEEFKEQWCPDAEDLTAEQCYQEWKELLEVLQEWQEEIEESEGRPA